MIKAWNTPHLRMFLVGFFIWFIPVQAITYIVLWNTWFGHGALATGGVILAAQIISQTIAYIMAILSDKIGRQGVIVFGAILTTIGVSLVAVSVTGIMLLPLIAGYLIVRGGKAILDSVTTAQISDLSENAVPYRQAMAAFGFSLDVGKIVAVGVFILTILSPVTWIGMIFAAVTGALFMFKSVSATQKHANASKTDENKQNMQKIKGSADTFNENLSKEPLKIWLAAAAVTGIFFLFSFWPTIAAGEDIGRYIWIIGAQSAGAALGNLILSKLKGTFMKTVTIGIGAILVGFGLLWSPIWIVGAFIWGVGAAIWYQELRSLVSVAKLRGKTNGMLNVIVVGGGALGAILFGALVDNVGVSTSVTIAYVGGLAGIIFVYMARKNVMTRKDASMQQPVKPVQGHTMAAMSATEHGDASRNPKPYPKKIKNWTLLQYAHMAAMIIMLSAMIYAAYIIISKM